MCGTSEWEWEEDRYAYEAASRMCWGCQRLDAAREDGAPAPGISMVLIPKKKAEELSQRRR